MIPSPPSPFPAIADAQIETVHPGAIDLHRFHDRNYRGDAFNPCRGKPTRFAPIYDSAGRGIPSLYAGATFDCAAFESVFHEVPMTAALKTVREQTILSVAHTRLSLLAPLGLVKLYAPDLGRCKLRRTDLIDTPASEYASTAPWAQAIHAARADAHGLIWTSRRFDPLRVVVLWGDRVATSSLRVDATQAADRATPLYAQLHALAARYGITITL